MGFQTTVPKKIETKPVDVAPVVTQPTQFTASGNTADGGSKPSIEVKAPLVIEVSEAVVTDKRVRIVPRRTITTCRIGPAYYQFTAGKAMEVPAAILPHLKEHGIV